MSRLIIPRSVQVIDVAVVGVAEEHEGRGNGPHLGAWGHTGEVKQEALEPILRAWQTDPARVRQLCGWHWIREALKVLPADTQVIQS